MSSVNSPVRGQAFWILPAMLFTNNVKRSQFVAPTCAATDEWHFGPGVRQVSK